jgi:hypothetical protein
VIKALALDRSDGWVFARDGERFVLMRPPYRLAEAQVVSESVVARAVTHHGYVACDREFATWAEVVAFVRDEVAQQRVAEGRPLPDESVGRAFLRSAPASTVERFLERIRTELLPREELDMAARILQAIQIESSRLLESPELGRRTAALLEEVLRKQEERLARHVREDDRFPRLAQQGRLTQTRTYALKIASAGSMFVQPANDNASDHQVAMRVR